MSNSHHAGACSSWPGVHWQNRFAVTRYSTCRAVVSDCDVAGILREFNEYQTGRRYRRADFAEQARLEDFCCNLGRGSVVSCECCSGLKISRISGTRLSLSRWNRLKSRVNVWRCRTPLIPRSRRRIAHFLTAYRLI